VSVAQWQLSCTVQHWVRRTRWGGGVKEHIGWLPFARAEDAGSTPARSTKELGGRAVNAAWIPARSRYDVLGRHLAGICVSVRIRADLLGPLRS